MRLKRLIPAALAATALLFSACQKAAETSEAETVADAAPAACERTSDPAAMAEAEARAIAAAEASRGSGQPAMWTMTDEDTTLYILGTVHLLRPDLEWRTPEIGAAIAAADTVVFEADTTSAEAGRELMKFFSSQGMFTDGTQLTSLLTEEEVAALNDALTEVGLPLEAVQPMRPWYAALNLSVMQMTSEGFDPASGVEMKIGAEAAGHGAAFDYLETVDQQLGEFARLDNCAQVEFLMMTAASLEEGVDLLDLLVSEWADGDAAGLGALMASPDSFGSDAAYEALLTNRNARWTPLIAAMLDEPGTRLIAVGAGHLVGEDSVIAMLRAEGYEVAGP
ncbi:MAG: TraB/GumN family protein [Hyphomonas sp.]|uniref:TraB/GumN family protein n=1 Tax=Hyphomonas sp. TaxID=87 RepID=UPI0034A06D87